MYRVTEKEIASVMKIDPFERYKYFVKRVADREKIYLLEDDESYALSSLEEHILIPFWPFPEFAELCKTDEWKDYQITEIDILTFKTKFAELINNNNYLLNIMPSSEATGFVVNLEEFNRDLDEELTRYE